MTGVNLFDMGQSATPSLYERLFQTAVTQFRIRGYEAVSVSQITHETQVAKGTFFNYFPTKDHVLAEAYHRIVEGALGDVAARRLSGAEAILAFSDGLADRLAEDRVLTRAIAQRLSNLPTPSGAGRDVVRDEERVRSWIESRLAETLPISVPLIETDPNLLAFLVAWAIRGSVDEWVRSEAEEEALRPSLHERVAFLLKSAGLPAESSVH